MRELDRSTPLDALYESLARYHWWRRRLLRTPAGQQLEFHKKLRWPETGTDTKTLDEWLRERVAPPTHASVLDAGCGFGSTLFAWAPHVRGDLVGLTPSRFQVARATSVAQQLGLGRRCTFRRQSYDTPIAGSFEVVVAIEALFHGANLEVTLRNLGSALRPDGVLALVEDMANDSEAARLPEADRLLRAWATERLHTLADYRAALRATGFDLIHEHDLTTQVPRRDEAALNRRERWLDRLTRVAPLPGWRRVLQAFRGGVALERLYARGAMGYRVLIARRDRAT
jgi:SAM-dependent methyltransferase